MGRSAELSVYGNDDDHPSEGEPPCDRPEHGPTPAAGRDDDDPDPGRMVIWDAPPDLSGDQRAYREYVAEREAARDAEEARLRRRHPGVWAEWRRLWGLLDTAEAGYGPGEYRFAEFVRDFAPRPSRDHRLRRRRNRVGFTLDNLRWVVPKGRRSRPAPPPVPSPFLTYEEAAAYCNCAVKTLQNARSAGKLLPVPGGAGVRFTKAALDAYRLRR